MESLPLTLPMNYQGFCWRRLLDKTDGSIACSSKSWKRRHLRWSRALEQLSFHETKDAKSPALWVIPAVQIQSYRLTNTTIMQRMLFENETAYNLEVLDKIRELALKFKYKSVNGSIIVLKCLNSKGDVYEVNFAAENNEDTNKWAEILSKICGSRWYNAISTCLSPIVQTPNPCNNKFLWLNNKRSCTKDSPKESLPAPPLCVGNIRIEESPLKEEIVIKRKRSPKPTLRVVTRPLCAEEDYLSPPMKKSLYLRKKVAAKKHVVVSTPSFGIPMRPKRPNANEISGARLQNRNFTLRRNQTKKLSEKRKIDYSSNASPRQVENFNLKYEVDVLNELIYKLKQATDENNSAPITQQGEYAETLKSSKIDEHNAEYQKSDILSHKSSLKSSINELEGIHQHASLFVEFLKAESRIFVVIEYLMSLKGKEYDGSDINVVTAIKMACVLLKNCNELFKSTKTHTQYFVSSNSGSSHNILKAMVRIAKKDFGTKVKESLTAIEYIKTRILTSPIIEGLIKHFMSLQESLRQIRSVCRLIYIQQLGD